MDYLKAHPDGATAAEVIEHCQAPERGVSRDAVRKALFRLRRNGDIQSDRGRLRLTQAAAARLSAVKPNADADVGNARRPGPGSHVA